MEATGITGLKAILALVRLGRWLRTGSTLPPPDPEGERVLPGPEGCTPLLRDGITTSEPGAETERRRSLYRIAEELLAGHPACRPLFRDLPSGTVPYGYPFYCEAEEFEGIRRMLRRRGLLCISWPELPDAVKGKAPSFYDTVRLVTFLW